MACSVACVGVDPVTLTDAVGLGLAGKAKAPPMMVVAVIVMVEARMLSDMSGLA